MLLFFVEIVPEPRAIGIYLSIEIKEFYRKLDRPQLMVNWSEDGIWTSGTSKSSIAIHTFNISCLLSLHYGTLNN